MIPLPSKGRIQFRPQGEAAHLPAKAAEVQHGAVAMAGHAFELLCPVVVRVVLENELQPWVSAKDIILSCSAASL